jgi:cytoskeletal protein CcmA (bactofilin family)
MKIKPNKQAEPKMEGKMNTIIGKDSTITGTIDVKGPLRIDGIIKGQVNCEDTVTVGAGGELEAEINCKTAVLAGNVTGNVIASEKVELQAKAEISGDLKTRSLVIEQGAVFCGSCNMKSQDFGEKKYTQMADKVRQGKEEAQTTK